MADYSADPREARAASLLSSLKRMFVTLLEVVQTRLELASTELEEERARLQEIAIYGLVAVFFLGIGVVLATILVIMVFWDTHRLQVLTICAAIYLVLGVASALVVRNKSRSKPKAFSSTLAELRKDREHLSE
jgi:uncharacterized membrane protein YqjE